MSQVKLTGVKKWKEKVRNYRNNARWGGGGYKVRRGRKIKKTSKRSKHLTGQKRKETGKNVGGQSLTVGVGGALVLD